MGGYCASDIKHPTVIDSHIATYATEIADESDPLGSDSTQKLRESPFAWIAWQGILPSLRLLYAECTHVHTSAGGEQGRKMLDGMKTM